MTNFNTTVYEDPAKLRELYAPPDDRASEPVANFPLLYYEHFLREIKRLDIRIITFRDLFKDSNDWDYQSNYAQEYLQWRSRHAGDSATYLVLQHDVDNHPFFTKRMVAMEMAYGVRSNIFIFRKRFSTDHGEVPYDVDHEFLQYAQQRGFVIGYHQNALQLAHFDLARAVEIYRSDVAHLRRLYNIEFVVPHGGMGTEINGAMQYNQHVPMPPELTGPAGNLRWVYNGHRPHFDRIWTDGGILKTRNPDRIAKLDLVRAFLHELRPGTRNFALIHPQRWGYNVDPNLNPLLATETWYRDICEFYAHSPAFTAHGSVNYA
jgi:hypothetical protein